MTSLARKQGRFRAFLAAVFFCVFGFHPVWADDIEIFFSPVTGADAQPNILLVLDASASMLSEDGTNTTRQERMNAAMGQVLNRINNVNIGVMRFSNRNSGGRVIYPVRDIETFLCDGAPCASTVDFEGSVTTARQEILDTILTMNTQWDTPTVGAMLEAEAYFVGAPVNFGKKRVAEPCPTRTGGDKTNCEKIIRVNGNNVLLDGIAVNREEPRVTNVSHPDSYTGGVLVQDPICAEDPTDVACATEEITGNPVYISPIANECQSNHILLVADGAASDEAAYGEIISQRFASCEAGVSSNNNRGRCLVELADYMANEDLINNSIIDGKQTITTHTVGFNIDDPWLQRIASGNIGQEGAGNYFTANSTEQLVTALVDIIVSSERKVESTLVAPGVTVDQFSRLSHRKDTYLALFEPSDNPQWPGNMKRYDLFGGALFDASEPPIAAVDNTTGRFNPNSRSFWSNDTDGHDITAGGARSQLPTHTFRNAVTYTGSDDSLLHSTNAIATGNTENLISLSSAQVTNIAPLGQATQSSTGFAGGPGRAIDSNTNGRYNRRSVSHTGFGPGHTWWQLDLLEEYSIKDINIFGRTDCCTERLSDVNIFVSNTPFASNANPDEIQADSSVWRHHHAGVIDQASRPYIVSPNRVGRYVRIQLDAPNVPLSLAEVQVFGTRVAETELARLSNLVEWVRGKDVKDEDGDSQTDETRYYMGDPLHSAPHIVTYGGTEEDPESVVFMGTNEGFLHAFDSRTGEEDFAFMPKELLPNLDLLFENSRFIDKVYGMDGDITSWINDHDDDGIIDEQAGDHAYIYAGMRRGGSNYYALDVTDRTDPKFLFQIPTVDTIAYAELGQSWSRPTTATIKVGSEVKEVLIFAGGYDEAQDDKKTYSDDTVGRAIFIADAEDGSLIWSGQPNDIAGLPIKQFPKMQYSIPSNIKVVDPDGDGLASQLYVGDMGGQLWRFDINNGETGIDLVDGGVIAQFGDQTQAGARRFFHEPDLVLTKHNGDIKLSIGIGSGYQAHPLDTVIDDRYYQMRYPLQYTGNYGLKEENSNSYRVITETDLYDTTDNLIGEGTETEVSDARLALNDSEGWYIRMERPGEKILGSSATLQGVVRFVSYLPPDGTGDICTPDIGSSNYFRVSLTDGTPPEDENSDGTRTKQDRSNDIPGGGIAPAVTTVFVSDPVTGEVNPNDVSGVNVLREGDNVNTVKRRYWSEKPE